MSGSVTAPQVLRLVYGDSTPVDRRNAAGSTAAQPVWTENQSAAKLSPTDARWALAVRTSQVLEGGRVAMLAPDKRRTLVRLAGQMGLRDFDAALVIAIVQDAARLGEPLTRSAQDRLAMIRPATPRAHADFVEFFGMFTLAAVLGGFFFSLFRVWLLG